MRLFVLLSGLLGAVAALGAEPASVSFYECRRCAAPPVLDGKLDDACWQGLPQSDQFFQYWSPIPKPPGLRTGLQVCYDNRALYLGITMYEANFDGIKATLTSRDDPEMWTDDCVEIMFDPDGTGTGYYKFTTNYLAARYDEKTTNMVMDAGWNVEGWQVKTSRGPEAWYIEFALPWSDLGRQPRDGDLWGFNLVRYGYSSGGFKGVSWALGGSYAAPGKFGYLGFGTFAPFAKSTLRRMNKVMDLTKGESYRLLLPTEALTYDHRAGWTREPLAAWLSASLTALSGELTEANSALAKMPAGADRTRLAQAATEVQQRLAELQAVAQQPEPPGAGLAAVTRQEALGLRRRAAEVKWEAKLLGLVAQP